MFYNYNEADFVYFVVSNTEIGVLGIANIGGQTVRFLISDNEVKQRVFEWWEPLNEGAADIIRRRAHEAYGRVRVHRVNADFASSQ